MCCSIFTKSCFKKRVFEVQTKCKRSAKRSLALFFDLKIKPT